MTARRQPFAAAGLAAALLLAVASCGTWEAPGQMPPDDSGLALATPGLAVAPVIGAPLTASEQLARAIAQEAKLRGVHLAEDNRAAGFDYVLEGTASAQQTPQGTVIAFAWDLTDADGIRQHRFVDTQIVPTRSPEVAWGPAGEASLAAIAGEVADELEGFFGARMALAPDGGALAPDGGARPRQMAGAAAAPITTASLPGTSPPAAGTPAPVDLTGPLAIHVRQVAGEPRVATPVLEAALRAALWRKGAHLVASPEPGVVLMTGSVVIRPAPDNGDLVSLDWSVTLADGTPLGDIVQERIFAPGSLAGEWETAGTAAAEDAARALFQLVSPERDNAAATAALRELRGFTPPEAY